MSSSMVTVRLRRSLAVQFLEWLNQWEGPDVWAPVREAFHGAVRPTPPKPKYARGMSAHNSKSLKHSTKREETRAIWEACSRRAGGVCECGCGRALKEEGMCAPTLDHWFGRGKGRLPQSERTCWILTYCCHLLGKSLNKAEASESGARIWHEKFIAHCRTYGYTREADEARKRLEGIIPIREDEKRRRSGLQSSSPVE